MRGTLTRRAGFVLLNQLNMQWISPCGKRYAGFQGSISGQSMEMKMRLIEHKKKKVAKLEKEIRDLIPITDFYVPYSWKSDERKRSIEPLSDSELEERILMEKAWSKYRSKINHKEIAKHKILIDEQDKALEELKQESHELYEAAMECIDISEPFTVRGPVQTLPLKSYVPPLGGYAHSDPPFSTDEVKFPD